MFRAASFGGQFALLVARHLYVSVFSYYLLIHWPNKICSVLFCTCVKRGRWGHTVSAILLAIINTPVSDVRCF